MKLLVSGAADDSAGGALALAIAVGAVLVLGGWAIAFLRERRRARACTCYRAPGTEVDPCAACADPEGSDFDEAMYRCPRFAGRRP